MTLLRWPLLGAVVAAVLLGFAVLRPDREPQAPPTPHVVSSFWTVPVTGGRPRLLFRDRGQDTFPTYRRGGRSILFARPTSLGSTALFSATLGGEVQRLRALPVFAKLAYSPATDEIAVKRGSAIVAANLTSGRTRVLAQTGHEQCCSVWSADGSTLAFGRLGDQPELVLVRGKEQRVFHFAAGAPSPLALSPRGDRLLFSWGRQLFLLNTHTGRRRLFTTAGSNSAAWSPDGSAILYYDRDGLVARNLRTNRRSVILPKPNVAVGGASFSPDGKTVVYTTQDVK
jgi:Tol biopolymer transport system component